MPVFTVILFLLQAGGACFFWRWLSQASRRRPTLKQPITGLALFGLFALVLFLLGRFSATIARLRESPAAAARRELPAAAAPILCLAVALGIVGVQSGFRKGRLLRGATRLCGLLALVAVETLVALVLEIYRPRVKGKVERPLYESRLVGLLGQPEGLITTAAQALDYQFGFKVSETWFYRFFEQALGWLMLLQVGALLLSTCVVFIEPGEQGLARTLRQAGRAARCSAPARISNGPGPSTGLPLPHRADPELRRRLHAGPGEGKGAVRALDRGHTQGRRISWWPTASSCSQEATNQVAGKRTPPVSLLTVSIPVQFQITNLVDWAYNNEDAAALLQDLATREVVRYLVGADMNEIMSHGRDARPRRSSGRAHPGGGQPSAQLGASIISVGLQDCIRR